METFWKNKKVLVTGGKGFVGSHLVKRLINLGAKVFILEKTNYGLTPILSKELLSKVKKVITGDIRDKQFIDSLFKEQGFEICFHLAAQSSVDRGYRDPLLTFEVNIMGTANILEAAKKYKLGGLVLASTTHVYGENKLPFLEEYFPRPSGPYETSKACADILAQTYAKYYKLPLGIARFVNIYGPGDQNERVIPRTIQLILNNQNPEIFNPKVTRDYLYIDDAINAYLILGEKMRELSEQKLDLIFNFGTGRYYSTKELVEKIISLIGKSDIEPIVVEGFREQEIINQYVSIEKAKTILGWRPQHPLEQGLKKTIEWYKSLKS